MELYQEKIKQNYLHPQNSGEPDRFTHRAKVANLSCGDEVEIFLSVDNDQITDIHHVTSGCAVAVAAASILTSYLDGKTLTEIEALDHAKVEELLDMELGSGRERCAGITVEALKDAVSDKVA